MIVLVLTVGFGSMSFTLWSTPEYDYTKRGKEELKVMAYNIHHANPPSKSGHIDIDAIVKVIRAENPDIVALQEVDVHTNRSGNIDQAKVIADKLGMHYFFAKAIDYDGGEYGQVILSKIPISEERIHRLPFKAGAKAEPRILATVKVNIDKKRAVRFGTVHLDAQRDPANRLLQVEKLNTIAGQEKLPFIIAGDFNAAEHTEPLQILLGAAFISTCENCPFTIPVINPRRTIDFILLDKKSPWEIVSHRVIDEQYASDHLPVVAKLRLR